MILSKLILNDFRQFYGESELVFSTDLQRNVTLIHGENGVGKTTILNAILWCFFEYLTPDFEQPKDLINHEAAAEGRRHCRVEVHFVHDKENYVAQRIFNDSKPTTFRVHKVEDGNFREMPAAKSFINSVLPSDMAPYFFFHGEGVAAISEGSESQRFRNAVRTILGFTFAEQAIDDLTELQKQYARKVRSLQTENLELKRASVDEARAQKQKDRWSRRLADIVSKTRSVGRELREVGEALTASGNADVRSIKRQIDEADRRRRGFEGRLHRVNRDRLALVERFGWAVFGSNLMEQGLEFIDESTLKGRIPAPYQEQFVEDLLKDRRCICGRKLEQGTDQEFRVRSLLEGASTAELNQRVMKARSAGANLKGRVQEFLQEIEQLEKRRTSYDQEISLCERTLSELETQLEGIDEAEIGRLVQRRSDLVATEKKHTIEQGALRERISQEEQNLKRAQKAARVAGANDLAFKRHSAIRQGISEMINRCSTRLDSFEKEARALIADAVNQFLDEFSRKHYTVRVSESFDFHLARTDGKLVAKSQGEKLLLNLAFVAALIQHARRRQGASGRFLVRGTVAPFVIDAPFGELDDTYRKATAELLPPKAEQIVLLLSSSHWTGTVDEAIRSRVAREYVLVSNRKGSRGMKPSDTLTIDGRPIDQSRYDQDKDCTTVEGV